MSIFLRNTRRHDIATVVLSTAKRSLSSSGGGGGPSSLRAFPQHNVFTESAVLSLDFIPPSFRVQGGTGGDVLRIDPTKKGKILLGFTARRASADRVYDWKNKIKFALSADELGLIISQIPNGKLVELSRSPSRQEGEPTDVPDKVLKIHPSDDGSGQVTFTVDYVKDGIGGQPPGPIETGGSGPVEVTAQAGEFEVIKSIFQSSIPHLIGWTHLVENNIASSINSAVTMRSDGGNPHQYQSGSGGGGGYNSGGPGSSDTY